MITPEWSWPQTEGSPWWWWTEMHIKKAEELLNQPSYKTIPADPTTKQRTSWYPVEKHQSRRWDKWSYLQKNVSYRSRIPKILWVTINSQRRSAMEIHGVQQRGSFPWDSKGTGLNSSTLGRKISIPCPQHQGLCRAYKMHPVTTK